MYEVLQEATPHPTDYVLGYRGRHTHTQTLVWKMQSAECPTHFCHLLLKLIATLYFSHLHINISIWYSCLSSIYQFDLHIYYSCVPYSNGNEKNNLLVNFMLLQSSEL